MVRNGGKIGAAKLMGRFVVRNGGKIWGSKWREDLGFEMAQEDLGLRNGGAR